MRNSVFNMNVFKERRELLKQKMKPQTGLIVAAHPEYVRNNDVEHAYRPDSNMVYLCGFEEPESVFLFRPGHDQETILFVREKDPFRETWDGFRYGVDGAKEEFKVDATYSIEDFHRVCPGLLSDLEGVYINLFSNHWFDSIFEQVYMAVDGLRGRTNKGKLEIKDSRTIIGEMRLFKSQEEISWMRHACEISSEAHIELMKACKPGMNERSLHGLFLYQIMARGSAREGYGSIVAGGDGATTLHYVFNDQPLKEGEMVLIDAGAEYRYMSSDITRTFPVSGKFSEAQKRVYQAVLDLQKELIEMVAPGMDRSKLQNRCVEGLVDIMIAEKLLKGSASEIIESRSYAQFYPHGVGHWLGMDVHDAGAIEVNGEPRPFEPGIILTIEPGLYVSRKSEGVPEELKGLGIRIEDNILVTSTGHENMTVVAPKEVEELENLVGVNYKD
ncbi:MAG: aminopeptidase P N-terminal domain-containing protein [Bdellovibrionales bacterium]|nr:aminopeptidase P N-terminal domain-containing protein [Bdellovibrionales bacterium]